MPYALRSLAPALTATMLTLAACGDAADDGPSSSGGGDDPSGSSSSGTGGASGGEGLPCDVSDVLVAKCQSCHSDPPKFGAPMPLVDRDDLLAAPTIEATAATHASVGLAVIDRIESEAAPMPPPPGALDDAEKQLLRSYVEAGMPASDEQCGGTGGGGTGGYPPLDCEPDVALVPAAPYTMPQTSVDEYVCFGVEMDSSIARHITAIAPRIDNETILHHILFMQAPDPVSAQGTSCNFTNTDWKLLYAWGPGTEALVLPEEAGFPVGPGNPGHFVIQTHYNNVAQLVGETDQSGIDLCTTTELRPYDADIMAFGGVNFSDIGPNQEATLECTTPIPSIVDSAFPVTIFQAWPHMHELGREFTSVIEKAGGGTIPLADVPNYDFEYQIAYPTNAVLDVGDSVRTRCTWQNTTSNPVGFGEGTGDEMCFNFVGYYPRVELPQWSWLVPSAGASCSWQ
jgi:hypothetical protein